MPVQFIGFVHYQETSESLEPRGPAVQPDFVRDFARAQEDAGFDRVLIGYASNVGDGFVVAQHAAAHTTRLGVLIAHRPGFVAPTVAARKFATLDQFTNGRVSVNIISGSHDAEQRRDGDYLSHDERYERTAEFVDVLKAAWTSEGPFDHDGKHYRFNDNFSPVKPVQKPHIPIYFSGSSDAAIAVGARVADVYMLWAESLTGTRDQILRIKAAAAKYGRAEQIGFSLSVRPILADTEKAAWDRAESILARAKALAGASPAPLSSLSRLKQGAPSNVGTIRLLRTAAEGPVVDKRLWTEMVSLPNASGNTTALVGTPDQVAESLLDYYDLGVTRFLLRGFDPFSDAVDYGRALIPIVKLEVAGRDADTAVTAAE
ncbi:LLM class flavin-dependent oxidoreductase [Methylosinus sp. RM1]|uniref:LLM class flavin-dependent oxidoreductase n=1 Tax=Methylosinus sp. RM1 TaxID=2583817 RepID=UPI001407C50C|nr:LLM class flavin-dependent oxidoreductase [Methylosinus sp. RM1]